MTTHVAHVSESVTAGSLLFRKMATAFIVAFVSTFVPALTGWLQSLLDAVTTGGAIDLSVYKALVLSAAVGAAMAGVRAILALLPLNIVPTDKLLGFGRKASTVTVSRR